MEFRNIDEHHLSRIAAELASAAARAGPLTIHLQGELGAGKTTFARHLLWALGHEGRVKSPSYGLVEPYRINELDVFHLDLYRLSDPEELEFIGIRDLESSAGLLLIEWPERGRGLLATPDLTIHLTPGGQPDRRTVRLLAHSPGGEALLENISDATAP